MKELRKKEDTDATRELAKREFDDPEAKIKKNQMSIKSGGDKKE